ncbi:phenylacetate-CoA ligase [Amycolatopsis bartoniae]|uniref:CoA ligase n=1 Tax=Amycolatopsis bartoniae TaxID=941986 RepID=A0A8H9IWC3_9PSEU|nr:AMP-binding protein [Amycolatopsis bartoniae]MBB2937875.1 phenylacetate-CoA ligase [Amycolatopsis bartoniae]TVT01316.1 phenylacetate--CoA ligase [Amycolatopsis bartoniae]GHF41379.1 CoA ligase [Amycolatopsis bartoniae]
MDTLHECETAPPERLRERRLELLRTQLTRVYEAGGHYRRQWDELGWHPAELKSLDDLAALPCTDKTAYQRSLDATPPYGEFLAVPREDVARVHFSSGTTGRPAPVCWTRADLDRWAALYARAAYSQGVRPGDVYQCLFGFAWFVGGLGGTLGYTELGAAVIPGGSGDTERQIDTIFRYGTTAVGGTPSFLLHLAARARELGTPLSESGVRHVMVGGEPGGAVAATRALIEREWGARCFDGYGCLEFQPIAWECAAQAGGHLAEDFVHAEVLDPATREPVPDGEPGVLVLTHLDKQACPLVRWWTGDVVVLDRTPCECGRTHARLAGGVRGRADDMLVVRGVNVFPSAVENVVRRTVGDLAEFRVVLDPALADPATGYPTALRLQVEAAEAGELPARLAAALRAELQVRAVVDLVEPGVLPRTTHKARRVVRASESEREGSHRVP